MTQLEKQLFDGVEKGDITQVNELIINELGLTALLGE